MSDSAELNEQERAYFDRVAGWEAADGDIESSLINLTRLLFKHHGRRPVVLIDEYDAPVMAARDNGYYDEMVSFLKGWLTAALKDGRAGPGLRVPHGRAAHLERVHFL
ncbi:MAG: AAA family ATPase [Adlercreutzia equolifaciens]